MISTSPIPDAATQLFWQRHTATTGGIVVCDIVVDGLLHRQGMFTSYAKATAWAESVRIDGEDVDDITILFSPFVLDEPDYGNVPRGQMS